MQKKNNEWYSLSRLIVTNVMKVLYLSESEKSVTSIATSRTDDIDPLQHEIICVPF